MPVEQRVEEIRLHIVEGRYTAAAREGVVVLEYAFREVFRRIIGELPTQARTRAQRVEEQTGGSGTDLEQFNLTQLVKLFDQSRLFKAYREASGNQLRAVGLINFGELIRTRNDLQHHLYEASRAEAQLLLFSVESMLEAFGILTLEDAIVSPSVARETATSDAAGRADGPHTMKGSLYDPERAKEYDRLQIQADRTVGLDRRMIQFALDRIGRSNLTALDVGCADGRVTASRLAHLTEIDLTIGIDKSDFLLSHAAKYESDRLQFARIDLDAVAWEEQLQNLLKDHRRESVDVVLAAVTLHHLTSPIRVLRGLRWMMSEGGVIIVRAKDDGARLAYPDEHGRAEELVRATHDAPGTADRQSGRKLAWQLTRAGFRRERVFTDVYHTVGMTREERHRFFLEAFSFRRNYWARAAEERPSDTGIKRRLSDIDQGLAELELDFESEGFLYMELAIGCVAFR